MNNFQIFTDFLCASQFLYWKASDSRVSSEKLTERVLKSCKTSALSSGFFYSFQGTDAVDLPLDEKRFPDKTQKFITIHWIDLMTNGSSSGLKLYT